MSSPNFYTDSYISAAVHYRDPSIIRTRVFCWEIDDFTDIKFVSLVVLRFVGVLSKHLRVFLRSLRQSSEIFGNFQKFWENVRERSAGLRNNFGKSSESG